MSRATHCIYRLSADIDVSPLKGIGRVKLHVPQLRFLRSNKATRELVKKWHLLTLGSSAELGFCRLRIADWNASFATLAFGIETIRRS